MAQRRSVIVGNAAIAEIIAENFNFKRVREFGSKLAADFIPPVRREFGPMDFLPILSELMVIFVGLILDFWRMKRFDNHQIICNSKMFKNCQLTIAVT